MNDGTGAHGAGLKGNIHIAVVKAPVADLAASLVYCYDFGVKDGITLGKLQVMGTYKDFAVLYDNATDRAFAFVESLLCLLESLFHETFFFFHAKDYSRWRGFFLYI